MNQHLIYGVLSEIESRIYSFEDYPALNGSWRVSFFCNGYICEICSNRKDGFMYLKATKKDVKDKSYQFKFGQYLGDEFELNYIKKWLKEITDKTI